MSESYSQDWEEFIDLQTKGRRSKAFIYKKIMNDCNLYYLIFRKYILCVSSIFSITNHIYIRNIYIKPEFRKQGIAKKLLMNLFYDLINDGVFRAELEPNADSIEYWEKWGFNFIDNANKRMFIDLHNIKNIRSYNDYPRIYLEIKRLEKVSDSI